MRLKLPLPCGIWGSSAAAVPGGRGETLAWASQAIRAAATSTPAPAVPLAALMFDVDDEDLDDAAWAQCAPGLIGGRR